MHHVVKALQHIAQHAGPLGRQAAMLARRGEWAQLQELRCEPTLYSDSERFFWDNACVELLRKCKLPSGIDTVRAAKVAFIVSEQECAKTNATVSSLWIDYDPEMQAALIEILSVARKEIAWVLGDLPSEVTFLFSQGATLNDRGKLTTIPDKMTGRPTIYPHSRDVLLPFFEKTAWFRSLCEEQPNMTDPECVRGNRFFTVPKDGKTDRGCCVEASLNVSAQLGVGRVMRTRLRKWHIDLNEGQDLHRALAREGSRDGHLATVDMSRASDTVSTEVVRALLPEKWFSLLDSLRARFTEVDGRSFWCAKFSSMGNGFTFELETLIFAGLARALQRCVGLTPYVAVYGDDVILPSGMAHHYQTVLKCFGFTPNPKKTFDQGPFRESCGGDFFDGTPVRAHYLKELPNEPQQWIALANGIRRMAFADPSTQHRWGKLRAAWLCILDALPSDLRRLRGPATLGDLTVNDDESTWCWAKPGTHVWGYAPIPVVIKWCHWRPLVQLASCTLGLGSEGVTPRDGVAGYRKKRIPLPSPDPRRLAYGYVR